MIYIKSNEHNITNNYNDKVKMILRSRFVSRVTQKPFNPLSQNGLKGGTWAQEQAIGFRW